MTIIVAMHQPGRGTWIGSDRQVTDHDRRMIDSGGKWVMHGGWALAMSGLALALDIARAHAADLLDGLDGPDSLRPRLKAVLAAEGINPNTEERYTPDWGVEALLASAHGVWDMDGSLSATRCDGFAARGSGAPLALGAAWAMGRHARGGVPLPVSLIVIDAVRAACAHDIFCGGDVWFAHLDGGAS